MVKNRVEPKKNLTVHTGFQIGYVKKHSIDFCLLCPLPSPVPPIKNFKSLRDSLRLLSVSSSARNNNSWRDVNANRSLPLALLIKTARFYQKPTLTPFLPALLLLLLQPPFPPFHGGARTRRVGGKVTVETGIKRLSQTSLARSATLHHLHSPSRYLTTMRCSWRRHP